METTIIKFITFFFVFFSVARLLIQLKGLQQIYSDIEKSKNISLFDIAVYTMVNVTTSVYAYVVAKSILMCVVFLGFSVVSAIIGLMALIYQLKTKGAEAIIEENSFSQEQSNDDVAQSPIVDSVDNENFIKTNQDYLDGIDFSQNGSSKIEGFDWKNFKENNKNSNDIVVEENPVKSNLVTEEAAVNIGNSEVQGDISVSQAESVTTQVIEENSTNKVDSPELQTEDTKSTVTVEVEDIQEQSPLDRKLNDFDPDKHGGEVMATGLVGAEVFEPREDVKTTNQETEQVSVVDKNLENSEKPDTIVKKKSGRKKKPKNGQ